MRTTYSALVLSILCTISTVSTQAQTQTTLDPRVQRLADRILERIPDIPVTRFSLGRRHERPGRALIQAQAIVTAADTQASRWDAFAQRGNWEQWDSRRDLPALLAALALRESYMQPIVRLDSGERVRRAPLRTAETPTTVTVTAVRRRMASPRRRVVRTVVRGDMGIMQVRAPSGPARECGVITRADHQRLATDVAFGYLVGACVLTNHIDRFVDLYRDNSYRQLRVGQRPNVELRFYGAWGERRGTPAARLARELLVLERYNWGGRNLYTHPRGAGYARRVIREFEFFSARTIPNEG